MKGCLLKIVCIQLNAIAEVSFSIPFDFPSSSPFFFLYLSYNYKLILGIEPAKVPKDAKQKKNNKRSYQPLNNNQAEERANERQKNFKGSYIKVNPNWRANGVFPVVWPDGVREGM